MKLRTRDGSLEIVVDDVRLDVAPTTATERNALYNRCTTTTSKRGVAVDKTDTPKFNRELFALTVKNWGPLLDAQGNALPGTGVCDEDGTPIPCTEETKRNIAERNPEWVQDVLKRAARIDEEATATEQGNS